MIKKLALPVALLVLSAALGVIGYRLGSPEIQISNASAVAIEEVVVTLPNNRVAFGTIQPSGSSTIYYSADQSEGRYRYSIRFDASPSLSASCGSVSNRDYGKRLNLVVRRPDLAECEESNKVY